jgi:hypothetical protein
MSLSFSPGTLDFGCIAAGYIYTLDANIVNSTPVTQRVKLSLNDQLMATSSNKINLICRPVQFASGMSLPIKIELTAAQPSSSNRYQITATSDHGVVITSYITAFVLPMETFKYFAKSVSLRKKGASILKPGVTVVGPIVGKSAKGVFDRSFLSMAGLALTPGKSVFREALMDEEDVDDLLELPIAFNMYWDPKKKQLVMDQHLSQHFIDGTKSLDQCQAQCEELRNKRLAALERDGAYGAKTIEKLRRQLEPPPPVVIEEED